MRLYLRVHILIHTEMCTFAGWNRKLFIVFRLYCEVCAIHIHMTSEERRAIIIIIYYYYVIFMIVFFSIAFVFVYVLIGLLYTQ